MAVVSLTHAGQVFNIPIRGLINRCDLFTSDLSLLTKPYAVRSSVPLAVFRDFIGALQDRPVTITNENFTCLSLLCSEFGFQALSAKLSEFRASPAFVAAVATEDSEARFRIALLEDRSQERDREIAVLQQDMAQLRSALEASSATRADVARLSAEGSALKNAQAGLETKPAVAQISASTQKQFAAADAKLTKLGLDVLRLKDWSGPWIL
jgi:hypothetical protein